MTTPDRPVPVFQLDGSRFAGLNCTCAAAAMALDRHTIGREKTNGAYVRALTGDTTGGTTLAQIDSALNRRWGVDLDVEYGTSFEVFMDRIKAGQGAILQGWEAVTRGTRWQASETFGGNHAWFVNDHNAQGFLVYDPLADGRRDGIARSPFRVPKSVVQEWAGRLDVSDPDEPYRPLGVGKVYAAFTRDTEPHVHLHPRATRSEPFPDRTRADEPNVPVFAEPDGDSTHLDTIHDGDLFVAYQETENFLGNHGGHRWVRKRQMRRIGGNT